MPFEHNLASEFPEFKNEIHILKTSDRHFSRIFEGYELLCKELHRYGNGAVGISDMNAEVLKKKRLKLKDELFDMLLKTAA